MDEIFSLDETIKQYKINEEIILYRKNKIKEKRTKNLLSEVFNEFVMKANDFKENLDMYIVEKEIKVESINNSKTLMEILNSCINIELLKEYCECLGIVVDIITINESIKIKFILLKELYIEGVFDTYKKEGSTYIDKLNLVFKRK